MSNIIDSIQLSGVTYTLSAETSITVDSTLNSGSTNPVQNQTLYSELRITEVETPVSLNIGGETYLPTECTTLRIRRPSSAYIYFEIIIDGEYYSNDWQPNGTLASTVPNLTYVSSGNTITISWTPPAVSNTRIWTEDEITVSVIDYNVTPLISAVTAHTSDSTIHVTSADKTAWNAKQDTLSAGTGIQISGNVISATGGGGGGNPTVELTQAEYDALVTAGTVSPTTYYIITDAQAGDLSQYWTSAQTQSAITQATSGKVDTSTYNTYTAATDTALANKQTTLTAGTGIDITDNVISATGGGGGGKAVSGGTNISITTGETADTINCTLPMSTDSLKKIVVDSNYSSFVTSNAVITANSLSNNILIGNNTFKIKGVVKGNINNNLIIGSYNTSELRNGTSPTLESNLVVGSNNTINSANSLLVGSNNTISRSYQFAIGYKQHPNNEYETSLGQYNVSSKASDTFGDSGNTLFSVGNGTSSARHNAFEIRQNGDIYCSDGTNDVKLQDTITATAANTTALGGLKLVKLTQSEYDNLSTKGNSTLYVIVN